MKINFYTLFFYLFFFSKTFSGELVIKILNIEEKIGSLHFAIYDNPKNFPEEEGKKIGFKNVIVETEIIKVKYNSIFKLMRDLRGMGMTNNLLNRSKFFTPKSLFDEVNQFLIKDNKNKEFLVPFEILTLTAWKDNL